MNEKPGQYQGKDGWLYEWRCEDATYALFELWVGLPDGARSKVDGPHSTDVEAAADALKALAAEARKEIVDLEMDEQAGHKEVLALLYGFYFVLNQVGTPSIRTERRARVLSTIRRLEGRDAT